MITEIKLLPGQKDAIVYNEMGEEIINGDVFYGFCNSKGKLITECKYTKVQDFFEGLAAVENKGKWGFIDQNGKEIIPIKYDKVTNFSSGKSRVSLGQKSIMIDKFGKEVK